MRGEIEGLGQQIRAGGGGGGADETRPPSPLGGVSGGDLEAARTPPAPARLKRLIQIVNVLVRQCGAGALISPHMAWFTTLFEIMKLPISVRNQRDDTQADWTGMITSLWCRTGRLALHGLGADAVGRREEAHAPKRLDSGARQLAVVGGAPPHNIDCPRTRLP